MLIYYQNVKAVGYHRICKEINYLLIIFKAKQSDFKDDKYYNLLKNISLS